MSALTFYLIGCVIAICLTLCYMWAANNVITVADLLLSGFVGVTSWLGALISAIASWLFPPLIPALFQSRSTYPEDRRSYRLVIYESQLSQ